MQREIDKTVLHFMLISTLIPLQVLLLLVSHEVFVGKYRMIHREMVEKNYITTRKESKRMIKLENDVYSFGILERKGMTEKALFQCMIRTALYSTLGTEITVILGNGNSKKQMLFEDKEQKS